jgi:hypothetical protein
VTSLCGHVSEELSSRGRKPGTPGVRSHLGQFQVGSCGAPVWGPGLAPALARCLGRRMGCWACCRSHLPQHPGPLTLCTRAHACLHHHRRHHRHAHTAHPLPLPLTPLVQVVQHLVASPLFRGAVVTPAFISELAAYHAAAGAQGGSSAAMVEFRWGWGVVWRLAGAVAGWGVAVAGRLWRWLARVWRGACGGGWLWRWLAVAVAGWGMAGAWGGSGLEASAGGLCAPAQPAFAPSRPWPALPAAADPWPAAPLPSPPLPAGAP